MFDMILMDKFDKSCGSADISEELPRSKVWGGVKDLTFSSRGAFVSKLKDDPGQFQGSRIIFAGDIKVEGIQ